MEKELFSTMEAAKVLRISRIAVFQKIKSGTLKATKVGRNYVIEKKVLREALGHELGSEKKKLIESAVTKTIRNYGEALKRLGQE